MCKVFSTKAAQAFKACTLYAYKITKKELHYTYFEVFFLFSFHELFIICFLFAQWNIYNAGFAFY